MSLLSRTSAVAAILALAGCGNTVETPTGAGGSATTTSSTKSATSTAASGSTSSSTTSAVSSSTGGAPCVPDCSGGLTCCNGTCVNIQNDPLNCGGCDMPCSAPNVLCEGTCVVPTCNVACQPGATCCGDSCCMGAELCCDVNMGGPTFGPKCTMPENGTCPVGCPLCA